MTVEIEYQDRFGSWKHFQSKHNEADAPGFRKVVTPLIRTPGGLRT